MKDREWLPRFWCEREASARPDTPIGLDVGGYLADPTVMFSEGADPVVKATSQLLAHRCVVLLGEPGAGKTTSVKDLVGLTRAGLSDEGSVSVLHVDLADYADTSSLNEWLRGPDIQTWASGHSELYLFLDSVDECTLEVRQVASILARALRTWPTGRLWLRVACRSADWPTTLETTLKDCFDRVAAVELLPLRRVDVAAFAASKEIEETQFLRAVREANVVPLALRPQTLAMLTESFGETGALPGSQPELYWDALQRLAAEQNPRRVDAGHVGKLTPFQRLEVASWVAAFTIFCARTTVSIATAGRPSESRDPAMLTLEKVESLVSRMTGEPEGVRVDRDTLQEALVTGLFTLRGFQRQGWAHQTYAEYLAAYLLHCRQLTEAQALALLTTSSETPEAHYLWSELSHLRQPKYEPALSDYLCNTLRDLLGGRRVIINREVEVRRAAASGIGESVDLRVEVATHDAANPARSETVVIEVKGCWNPRVVEDLTTQLCHRYMRDVETRHGIYVVFWFDISGWESKDDRRRDCVARRERARLNQQLTTAADELSAEGHRIAVRILDASYYRPQPSALPITH